MVKTIKGLGKGVIHFINRGHQRSVKAKKHILISFFVKGASILINFLLVPITLAYVQKEQYGIWLTLSSVVAWISFFDIGLGHGLRNKLAEVLAHKDFEKAKIYVSSTYAIIASIFSVVLLLFFAISPFLDWNIILNTTTVAFEELRLVVIITFAFACINFVLKLLYSIFLADQRPALRGIVDLISNFLTIVIIFILTKTTSGSLYNLSLTLGLTPVIILALAHVFFFRGDYQAIRPSLRFVRKEHFRELTSLGVKFFVLGITALIIFSTDNMIILQVFGPGEVPAYNIAHKYFGLSTTFFTIISVPFWSAYTEAYVKKDIGWIVKTNKILKKIWAALVLLSLVMLIFSAPFYKLWVPEIEIPFTLSLFMFIYVTIYVWGTIFVMFINGIGKVQLQLVVSIVGAIINIPLSYFFGKTCGMGSAGVILASTICIGYGPFFAPFQFKKIISGKAKGIWNR